MAAESMRPEGLRFLDILKPLGQFRDIAESGGGLNRFVMVAASVARALDAAAKDGLERTIEALIAKECANPVVEFEDYGKWRSNHNNADYSEYVKARDSETNRIPSLQNALDNLRWFEKGNESALVQFSSIDDLIRVSVSLSRLAGELGSTGKAETLISPAIDTRDSTLCVEWSNKKANADSASSALSEFLGSYEAARLLSARAAERAAAQYYRSLGEQVTDVSATQLVKSDQQWKDFDLLVGARPIDVKNARKSFSSPDTYVEHCVPKFKIERKYGAEVSIAGVLSDYGTEDQIWSGELKCQILGEINVSSIRRLYLWMRQRFGALLNLDGLWRQGYVPGWMFEYPESHYLQRRETIIRLADALKDARRASKSDDEGIPGWMLTLSANRELIESLRISDTRRKLLRDLHLLNSEVGFSRPSLFLYSMGVMLESMLIDSSSDRTASVLTELLFFDGDETHPLFLLDTQRYVASLIDLLSRVREEVVRSNVRFSSFLMPHPSILRGQREGLGPMTLIAYCGGWREVPTQVKCGAAPLFFGKHQTCASCGRLVCDDCGYCTESCSLVVERQASITKASRESFK